MASNDKIPLFLMATHSWYGKKLIEPAFSVVLHYVNLKNDHKIFSSITFNYVNLLNMHCKDSTILTCCT